MTRQELKNTLEQVDCILDLQEELAHYDGIDTDLFLARAYQLGLETGLETEDGVKGTLTQDYLSPSELMIDDWVVYHGDVDYEYPHKITGLATEDISVGDDGFLGGWKEMVSPIPLTKDMLVINGFDVAEEEEDVVCILFEHKFQARIWSFGSWLKISHDDVFTWHSPTCCVHNLQHALRMCGLHELADNFKLS